MGNPLSIIRTVTFRSFINSFIHSFIHSSIHSFIQWISLSNRSLFCPILSCRYLRRNNRWSNSNILCCSQTSLCILIWTKRFNVRIKVSLSILRVMYSRGHLPLLLFLFIKVSIRYNTCWKLNCNTPKVSRHFIKLSQLEVCFLSFLCKYVFPANCLTGVNFSMVFK